MNLLGKIFTVFILIASIAVMVVAMFVYATHRNWREDAQQLQSQLTQARADFQQLQSLRERLESELEAELAAERKAISQLESERIQLMQTNSEFQQQLDQLRQQERANTAAVASTQANNEALAEEVSTLRTNIRQAQQARDQAFDRMVRATDDLHQAQGRLTSIQERYAQIAQELGNRTALLRERGIDPHTDPDAIVPSVRGVISSTSRTPAGQLIEISVGADDGLKPEHTVEIFRGERYLGRAKILRTEPDRAVGQVLREFQQGQIQEGDNVATRLRIS